VYYIATGREQDRSAFYLGEVVRKNIEIPYPQLRDIVTRAKVDPWMSEAESTKRLLPYGAEIVSFVYTQIAQLARQNGVRPVWIFLPQVSPGAWRQATPEAVELARAAGFVIINLDGVYDAYPVDAIRLAEWDEHPNALGHRLIAERLYQEIQAKRASIFP
jgi:hypothetical protein